MLRFHSNIIIPSSLCLRFFSSLSSSLITTSQRSISSSPSLQTQQSSEKESASPSKIPGLDPPFSPIYKDLRRNSSNNNTTNNNDYFFSVCCRGCNQQVFDNSVLLKGNPGWPTFHSVSPFTPEEKLAEKNKNKKRSTFITNPSHLIDDVLRLSVDDLSTVSTDNHEYLKSSKQLLSDDQEHADELTQNVNHTQQQQKKMKIKSNKFIEIEEEEADDELSIMMTKEEKLLEKMKSTTASNMKKKGQHQQSLILRSTPPTMRWGISAVKPPAPTDETTSKTEKWIQEKEKRAEKKRWKGEIRSSVQIHHAKDVRTTSGVCRAFCRECDTFIGVVFSNEPKSPSGRRFVCNPSSLVFK